jgi:hypothetical protein
MVYSIAPTACAVILPFSEARNKRPQGTRKGTEEDAKGAALSIKVTSRCHFAFLHPSSQMDFKSWLTGRVGVRILLIVTQKYLPFIFNRLQSYSDNLRLGSRFTE